jgi:hypothetical protein
MGKYANPRKNFILFRMWATEQEINDILESNDAEAIKRTIDRIKERGDII